jgi:putative hydrolase of the HAD superfamily
MTTPSRRPAWIFDFGNVVAHFDYARACEALGRPRNLTGPELLRRARRAGLDPLVKRYESGGMDARAFSAAACDLLGLEDVGHEQFAHAWADIFTVNEPVAELVARLAASGDTLVLGSNTNDLHAAHFRRQFAATLAHFRRLVLSFEVGHIKPSPAFYRACAEAAGRPPGECVFIDDLPENVEGARAAGLRGLVYDHRRHDDLLGALAALGADLGAPA